MFVFAEKVVKAGAAERCVGSPFDGESFGWGDDGPERDLRASIADASASTVKLSADSAAPENLLCDRRRRVGMDNLEEVVDAEGGAEPSEFAVGDAGSIVNEGTLSAACCAVARRVPVLGFAGRSTPGGGWGSEEEEFLLAVVERESCGGTVDG
jgi:hypothetical protein